MLTALKAVNRQVDRRAFEALKAASMFSQSTDPDRNHTDFRHYRRLGGARRDLPHVTAEQIIERSLAMRIMNPLARSYLDIMVNLVTSEPIEIQAEDDAAQELLDDFWAGPYNDWPNCWKAYTTALTATGVLALPVAVNPQDGRVWVSYADPAELVGIKPLPENRRILDKVVWHPGRDDLTVPIVRAVLEDGENFGRLQGNPQPNGRLDGMLYFRANNLANETKGLSDLSASLEHLAGHEAFQAATLEQAQFLGRWVGTAKILGAQTDIEAAAARYADTPGFASYLVHNAEEEHNFGAPNSMGADVAERDNVHGGYACAPLGPPHLIRGTYDQGTRAVAADASQPFALKVEARIDDMVRIAETACKFALDSAVMVGGKRFGSEEFTIRRPKVLKKDLAVGAAVLSQVSSALVMAMQKKWIATSHAQEVFVNLLSEIGQDHITLDDVKARLEEEAEEQPNVPDMFAEMQDRMRQAAGGADDASEAEAETVGAEA